MISLDTIFFILVVHLIADYFFQDPGWAENKSHDIGELLKHTTVYSLFWFPAILLWTSNIKVAMIFTIATFLLHTITDFVSSKIVSKKFKRKEYGTPIPNTGAFTIIGIDQYFHYLQLFITYKILLL